MDLVTVHCAEQFDIIEGGNGRNSGFSPTIWDAGNKNGYLRLRRRIIYTKCAMPLRIGPAFEVVNMSRDESSAVGKSYGREESAYIRHIIDNYNDLADWTVFPLAWRLRVDCVGLRIVHVDSPARSRELAYKESARRNIYT